MSYYLQIDEHEMQQFASLGGYGDIIRWVKGLPQSHCADLRHLIRYGWSDKVAAVVSQLDDAIKNSPPLGYTLDSVQNMARLITAALPAEVITITDGLSASDGDDESSD